MFAYELTKVAGDKASLIGGSLMLCENSERWCGQRSFGFPEGPEKNYWIMSPENLRP